MDGLIQLLTDNPTLLAVALILVAVGGYTIVRRMVRPALFLLVLLAGYIGYLVMTEQELPEELQKGKAFIEEIADKEDEKVKEQNLLIKWWFLVAVFTTPYIDKLKLIPGVGDKTADKLAAKFPDEESIKNASIEQIASIHGVSIEMANDIKTYGKF